MLYSDITTTGPPPRLLLYRNQSKNNLKYFICNFLWQLAWPPAWNESLKPPIRTKDDLNVQSVKSGSVLLARSLNKRCWQPSQHFIVQTRYSRPPILKHALSSLSLCVLFWITPIFLSKCPSNRWPWHSWTGQSHSWFKRASCHWEQRSQSKVLSMILTTKPNSTKQPTIRRFSWTIESNRLI